jgi:hypothetical protein
MKVKRDGPLKTKDYKRSKAPTDPEGATARGRPRTNKDRWEVAATFSCGLAVCINRQFHFPTSGILPVC